MGKSPRDRAPVGRVQTGMASFCKPPPTAEQREQQHLEEGQKFKQQVQKQRADNQQRAAEAAKHKHKPGCGLVRQALNYILRGVRIGADRVKITLFSRGAERVHVPTVIINHPQGGTCVLSFSTDNITQTTDCHDFNADVSTSYTEQQKPDQTA